MIFVLFMLSSTAFDGLHGTQAWARLFWKGIYPGSRRYFTTAPAQQYAFSAKLYYCWQWLSLAISPLVYLAVFVALRRRREVGRARSTVRAGARAAIGLLAGADRVRLPRDSLLHLLLAQGGQIVRLVSDPFGIGWNLFGTARLQIEPFVVDVKVIWHTQVALILLGHIVSVYLAHVEALRLFPTARRAALSQLPMLVLMVLFTTFGLWILSLPLSIGGG